MLGVAKSRQAARDEALLPDVMDYGPVIALVTTALVMMLTY